MPTENTPTSKTKIAIVTGGSRGLGRNAVLSLAKRDVDWIFTYNSNKAEAEKSSAWWPGRGERPSPCSSTPAT